jgi:hypothetical protein
LNLAFLKEPGLFWFCPSDQLVEMIVDEPQESLLITYVDDFLHFLD